MPIDATIPLGVQQPNAMNLLGSLLTIGNQAQQLTGQRIQNESNQRTLTESNNIRQLMQNPQAFTDATGNFDWNKFSPAVLQAAPTLGPQYLQQMYQGVQQHAAATKSLLSMSAEQMKPAIEQAGGILQDPAMQSQDPKERMMAVTAARDRAVSLGAPKDKIDTVFGPLLSAAQNSPQALKPIIANMVRGGLSASQQAQQSLVTAGGQQDVGGTDISGNATVNARDQFGNLSRAPLPANQVQGSPAMRFPAGENAQTAGPLYQLRDQAQAAGAQAPSQHFNNQQILNLAPSAFTGAGSGQLSKILGSVGLQSTNDVSADTAQLRHFIALQVEQNAASQGANTDAARQLAAQAVLPNDSPEKAIKSITKINDAYVTGNELFNQGIQSTLKSPNNKRDIFALRDYQNAWSQNFDPRIMMLENAARSGDKATIAKIKQELGPQGVKALLQKAQILHDLAVQGVE